MRDAFREIRLKLARMNAFLQEHLSGIKVVQAFAQEARIDGEFDVINLDYRRANARAISADAALYSPSSRRSGPSRSRRCCGTAETASRAAR